VLECLRPGLIGLNIVRRHHETVVSRCSPIFQVVDHDRRVGISGKTVQLYFRGCPAVDRGVRFVFVEFPCIDVPTVVWSAFRFTGKTWGMIAPRASCWFLVVALSDVTRAQSILPCEKSAPRSPVTQNFRAVKMDGAVVSAVHLVRIVELATVSCRSVFVMGSRFSVE
jgi:hypothetical protein